MKAWRKRAAGRRRSARSNRGQSWWQWGPAPTSGRQVLNQMAEQLMRRMAAHWDAIFLKAAAERYPDGILAEIIERDAEHRRAMLEGRFSSSASRTAIDTPPRRRGGVAR